MIQRLLREPLIHFLLIGALLFAVYGLLNRDAPAEDRIVVSQADIQRLVDTWTRQWRRPPDAAELQGLIDQYIREEILYREALALGLDEDDTIVRRRLAQKMEFIAEDLAMLEPPSDDALREFYEANAEEFAQPARLSFSHIYFNPDKRGAGAAADATLALEELRAAGVTDAGERGDRFLMQSDYRNVSQRDVSALFGSDFADALFAVSGNEWTGPLKSGFGLHLVRISDREAQRIPPLPEVREQVAQEYEYRQRRKADAAMLESLKSRYEIVVEPFEPVPGMADAS